MIIGLQEGLIRLDADLRALRLRWALVGGMAVSVRAEPRTTRDLDVALAVTGDAEAERIALSLKNRGYRDLPTQPWVERDDGRLQTVRLLAPGEEKGGLNVDLLFASSGVEPEVVAAADLLTVFSGVALPVAKTGHLIALKVLAGRPKDLEDIRLLLERANPAELRRARETLELIERRGFDRGKDLLVEFARLQG